MKRKSYIMPIVLLIFSLVVISFFAIYSRTIDFYKYTHSKENFICRKFDEISLEEILSTKSTINFINSKLNKREDFRIKVSIEDVFKANNILEFPESFKKYNLFLNHNKFKKKLKFFDGKTIPKDYYFYQYEIYFDVRYDERKLNEYKFIDKNRIDNYLYWLQIKNNIDNKKIVLNDSFYFELNKNIHKLYERIFYEENQNTYDKNLRIYDYKDKIYFLYNEDYLKLLEFYLSSNKIETNNIDLNLSDINDFSGKIGSKDISRNNFIEKLLLKNSQCISEGYKYIVLNINIKDKLFFDIDKEFDIYSNLIINDSSDIIVTNKSPKIQGVFVNNSQKENFNFKLEGILFSKNKIKTQYKFSPKVLDITARILKISDDFYLEKIEKNDIK